MKSTYSHKPEGGFTLIEMLVVLAVLAVLFATATPVALGVMQSSRLSSSGEAMLGRLLEAQQMAIAQDTDVEVRIYQGTDPAVGVTPRWCALQTFVLRVSNNSAADATGEGTFEPAETLLKLDASVAVSSEVKLSSLLNLKSVAEDAGAGSSGVGLTRHVAFRFHSDGSTDLTPGKQWFLTLIGPASGTVSSPPANYYAIQIDPATGRLRSFRP
jgi:uncharacterized protein (TIGR02596 family)